MFTLIWGTQIRPEWLLDVAPRGYFDAAKISEKCSARNKLDRVLTRRFSQDGPWYAHLTLKIQPRGLNRRLSSILSLWGNISREPYKFSNCIIICHTRYSIFKIPLLNILGFLSCSIYSKGCSFLTWGSLTHIEHVWKAPKQNTDSSIGILRSRTTRNERKSLLRAQLALTVHLLTFFLKAPIILRWVAWYCMCKFQACIDCIALYHLVLYVLPWFVDLPCLSKPVCSSSSGTKGNVCILVPAPKALSDRLAHIRSYVQH